MVDDTVTSANAAPGGAPAAEVPPPAPRVVAAAGIESGGVGGAGGAGEGRTTVSFGFDTVDIENSAAAKMARRSLKMTACAAVFVFCANALSIKANPKFTMQHVLQTLGVVVLMPTLFYKALKHKSNHHMCVYVVMGMLCSVCHCLGILVCYSAVANIELKAKHCDNGDDPTLYTPAACKSYYDKQSESVPLYDLQIPFLMVGVTLLSGAFLQGKKLHDSGLYFVDEMEPRRGQLQQRSAQAAVSATPVMAQPVRGSAVVAVVAAELPPPAVVLATPYYGHEGPIVAVQAEHPQEVRLQITSNPLAGGSSIVDDGGGGGGGGRPYQPPPGPPPPGPPLAAVDSEMDSAGRGDPSPAAAAAAAPARTTGLAMEALEEEDDPETIVQL